MTATTKYLHKSTTNAAPNAHTHSVKVSGTTGANSGTAVTAVTGVTSNGTATVLTGVKASSTDTFLKAVSEGSGYLKSYDAETDGTIIVDAGNRIKYVESVTHSGASASGTANAAPHSHTHTVTVSGTTGNNSGDAITAVTGVGADGTATALTGVKVTANPTISLTANTSTATGRIKYVEAISGGSGSLTTDTTSTNGIKYVESISGGSAVSKTTKYMKFSAGTTPKSGATPVHTSTNSGANSGTAVKAVTGYASFSGGSLTGTKTFNTDAIKSIGGTRNYGFSASTSNVMYSPTVSNGVLSWSVANASTQDAHTGTAASTGTVGFTAASLGTASTADVAPSGHTHTYDKTTSITLTAGTAPSMNFNTGSSSDTPYISEVSGGSAVSATTKYLHHSHSGASATTKYLSASASGTAVGANGTATVLTGVKATGTASVAPHTHTHSYGSSTALTTSGNSGTAVKAVTGVSGGSITPVERYLDHTHIASTEGATGTAVTAVAANGTAVVLTGVKASGTASVAPSGHTHSYGSSTALTTGNNTGSAVAAITGLTVNTTAATGDITYVESVSHTHTAPSVKSTASVYKPE
jgi:hypothetical protein